ncbi:uncharacterized protein LOC124911925 [Impatiens glandulifera]|uniref:uncharacterized protein LOC124911925 n=1 Tax=Impatiens glandulifera TaxID=253017 RepID=UPI001FB0503D|nr:uncharacterized protein LOC124911925 [Impatiens glandulifera]
MSILPESAGEEEAAEEEHSTHHPIAPPDESFDISTTVDPGYVISLIRKLLPSDGTVSDISSVSASYDDASTQVTMVDGEDECSILQYHNHDRLMGDDERDGDQQGKEHGSVKEDIWEDCGCILWDLAASQTHAEFMVQNLVLEVLLANLMIPQSVRVKEICLGILGNLACHKVSRERIECTNQLISVIVDQLMILDDAACLCETCRVVTLGLQGSECVSWAEALQPENILSRALWIAENALNPQLLEKILELLLAILESEGKIVPILLPNMIKLGLPSLLLSLLTFEMDRLTRERAPDRYIVLDLILQVIEALYAMDDYTQEVFSNKEFFQQLINLIKLPNKFELASSCVTAAVLFANILTDSAHLVLEISHDMSLLQGLFDIFPISSNDSEARAALWSVVARILVHGNEMDSSELYKYVSVFVDCAEVIEDDLLDARLHTGEANSKFNARRTSMEKIVSILSQWTSLKSFMREDSINSRSVDKLLEYCSKYLRYVGG